MGLDDDRVRVDLEQRVEREQVRRVLQDPTLVGVVRADEREVAAVAFVGGRPVLVRQPGRVGRHVREALVRDRHERLAQQLPALLHRVSGHVVHAGEVRVLRVELGEVRGDVLVHRVVGPWSRGGRGCGNSASHSSSPWWPGSAQSRRCSAVVPVRGSPVTKIGRLTARCRAAGRTTPRSAPRHECAAQLGSLDLVAHGVSRSSVAYASSSTRAARDIHRFRSRSARTVWWPKRADPRSCRRIRDR